MERKRLYVYCIFTLLIIFQSQSFVLLLETDKENNIIHYKKIENIFHLKSAGFWELSPFSIDDRQSGYSQGPGERIKSDSGGLPPRFG